MNKMDEISRAIGRLEGKVEEMHDESKTHRKKSMKKLDSIQKNVNEINGKVREHKNRIKTLEDGKWTWKKASVAVGVITTLFSLLVSIFLIIPMGLGIESCTEKEVAVDENCLITIWAWNKTSASFITDQVVEINITDEAGVKENSSLMLNNSEGLHNFTWLGSSTAGYKKCLITVSDDFFIPQDCSFVVNESSQNLIREHNNTIITTMIENHTVINNSISLIPDATWNFGTRTLTSFGSLTDDIWAYAGGRNLTNFDFSVGVNTSAVDDIDLRINQSHGVGVYNTTSAAATVNNSAVAIAVWNNSIVAPGNREVNATNATATISEQDKLDIANRTWDFNSTHSEGFNMLQLLLEIFGTLIGR